MYEGQESTERCVGRKTKAPWFLFVCALVFALSAVPAAWTQVTPSADAVPVWMAWRTFHNSLLFYNQKSSDGVAGMLNKKFGLSAVQATALLNAGQKYLSDTQQIEEQTRKEVQRRYMPGLSRPGALPPAGKQTTLERAKADGLFAQMEGLHQNAVDAHLNSLKGKLTDAQISQISTYVQTTLLSNIKLVTVGPAPSNPGLPPGVTQPPALVR